MTLDEERLATVTDRGVSLERLEELGENGVDLAAVLDALEERAPRLTDTTTLTRRMAEVAALREAGLTTEEVATALGISASTVRTVQQRTRERLELAANLVDELEESDL